MFKSIDEVNHYLDNELLECLICGKCFTSLHKHVFRTHDMRADDYKEKFGIPYSRGLVGTLMKEKLSDAAIELHQHNPEQSNSLNGENVKHKRRNPPKFVIDTFVEKSKANAKQRSFSERDLIKALLAIKSGLMLKDLTENNLPSRQTLEREAKANDKFNKVLRRAVNHNKRLRELRWPCFFVAG